MAAGVGPKLPGNEYVTDLRNSITGGHHDLIGWDPRGTGQTMTFSCFESPEARIYDALSKATFSGNSSDTALGRSWASATLTARTCAAYPDAQKKGNFIGTAFVARDMVQIVDALDDDKLLRYWGEARALRTLEEWG